MKVFVGGLPWEVDNVRLKEAFTQFGTVLDARVVFDKETNKSRGFGFVTFSEDKDAEKAIAKGSFQLDNRTVRIDRANEKRQQRGGGNHPQHHEPRDHEPRRRERRRGSERDSY